MGSDKSRSVDVQPGGGQIDLAVERERRVTVPLNF